VLATLGFILPSIGLLWVIYPLYQRYRDSEYVIEGMAWLRAAVLGLILVTLVRMAIKVYLIATPVWIPSLGLILLGTILLPILKNRPYAILAIGAVFGMIFF
jgi:chromate transport protein ChrA